MQAALYSLTAAESAGQVMGDSLMTALIGVVVVFATLVVLTLIFILFGMVMHRPKKEAPTVPAPKPKPAAAPKGRPRARRAGRDSGRGGGGYRGGGGFHGA